MGAPEEMGKPMDGLFRDRVREGAKHGEANPWPGLLCSRLLDLSRSARPGSRLETSGLRYEMEHWPPTRMAVIVLHAPASGPADQAVVE